jgi:Fe-S cluster assembly protein SufD
LNSALLHDGWRIHVSADTELSNPIGILVIDDAASAPGMSQTRVEIELESNSNASFIEYHASLGESDHYENTVITISLAEGARANYVRIQDRASNHVQTGRLSATLGRDSLMNHCAFDFGGALIRNDIAVEIASAGSSAIMSGLYLLGGKQHIDNHIRADHLVGPATSQQEYRGILTGSSRGVWNGKAIVHKGADGTDANQANHNLLLSEKAEIDAKPELEIYADDVKCSHGTTIGQLDEQALFYLRSRGLDRSEAKQLLTHAFAQAIVSVSPIKSLNEWLTSKIAARLGDILREDAA